MIKIVATITNFGAAMNIGGDPVRDSVIINIPTMNIPARLKRHIETDAKKYETVSFSLLDESE